jgi:hypothetical protein
MREYRYINHPQQKGDQERTLLLYRQLGLCRKEAKKDFQALCMDKVVKFITSTGRAMLMSGACSMVDGKPVWNEWTKTWDSEGWDGNTKFPLQTTHHKSESPTPSKQTGNSPTEPLTPCETEVTPIQFPAKHDSPKRARDSSRPNKSTSSPSQLQTKLQGPPQERLQTRPQNYLEEFSEYLNWEPSEESPPAKRMCFSPPATIPPTPLPVAPLPPAPVSPVPPSQTPARPFTIPRHLEGLRIVTPFMQAHFAASSSLTIDPRRLQV